MDPGVIRNFQEVVAHGGRALPGDLIIQSIEYNERHQSSLGGVESRWVEVRITGFLIPGGPISKEERVAVELMED